MIIKYLIVSIFLVSCVSTPKATYRPLPANIRRADIVKCTEKFIMLEVTPMESHKICSDTFNN